MCLHGLGVTSVSLIEATYSQGTTLGLQFVRISTSVSSHVF